MTYFKRLILSVSLVLLMASSVFGQWAPPATPRPGSPICDDWFRYEYLPKVGCDPETIRKICSGEIPLPHNAGPYAEPFTCTKQEKQR